MTLVSWFGVHHAGAGLRGEALDAPGRGRHAAGMMPIWMNPPPWASIMLPGLAAFALALGGMLATRRAEGRWAAVSAGALLVGWMLVAPSPRGWWAPRALVDHLVAPALGGLVGCAAAAWLHGRVRGWALALVLGFAAWWLAGAPVARAEFWRAWFGVVGVAWLLRLLNGRTAWGATLVGLVLVLGALVAGAGPVWIGVAAVMLGAALGVAALRPGAVLSGVGPAVGVVATVLGTGGLARGRLDLMDLVCAAAVLAPGAGGWVERRLGRRTGRHGRAAAVALTAVLAVAAAWGAALLLRR